MSRALLNPILDWLALRVACVMLSSVRPGKSRSTDRCPDLIVDRCSTLFLQDCVAVNPQDVVDTADAQTFSKEEGGRTLSAGPGRAGKRSRTARMTSALLRSCSVMNCRDPTATPSVMLPAVTAEVLAKLRTSPIFHSGGAASKSFTW